MMMSNDVVLQRLKAADPSPWGSREPEIVLSDQALRSLVDERIGTVSTNLTTDPVTQKGRTNPTRWQVAILSAAAVLLIGMPIALFGLTRTTENSEGPSAADDAVVLGVSQVAVVDSFFDDWNAASYDKAIGHLDEAVLIQGRAWADGEWRNFMEYTVAVGMRIKADCVYVGSDVRCEIDRIDPLDGLTPADASGAMTFTVVDGLITSFTVPSNRTSQDFLAEFAQQASPSDYVSACSRVAGSKSGVADFAFNAACGTHLATQIGPYVQALDEVAVVDAYFEAWNQGHIEATEALQHPELRVNGFQVAEDWTNFMAYTAAFDGGHDVECEPSVSGPLCAWTWNTPFANAQTTESIGKPKLRFSVSNGLVSSFNTPTYGLFEAPLALFASAADREMFETACASDGVSLHGADGIVFNGACGALLASHTDAFIESID
jgi:hypothetical protein